MRTKKILPTISAFLLLTLVTTILVPLPRVHAASDFLIHIDRIFTVSDDNSIMHVTERRTVTNNSFRFFLPEDSTERFVLQNFKEELTEDELNLKISTLSVTDKNGYPITFTTSQEEDNIVVIANYSGALNSGMSQIFELSYDTNELNEVVGKVTNVIVPGLEASYEQIRVDSDTNSTTEVIYNTELHVPQTSEPSTFIYPTPVETSEIPGFIVYTFSTESILGKSIWSQIGTEQIYSFKITQVAPQTDTTTTDQLSFLSQNKYTIALPRQYNETNQQVYFSSITPTPTEIWQDTEGNLLASFYVDANKETEILVEGYITVSTNSDPIPLDKTLDDIPLIEMDRYLAPAEYWEVNSPDIMAKAAELSGSSTNIIDILRSDYQFIVDSIDYDQFKYGSNNQRQGALATLNGGDSVCMEYSDLLIALTRAQGIPSRAAYGYGYDPKYSGDQLDHQWVQVWLPDYGWLTIDPTWGETGREFIGSDLDHALWYVAAENPNTPAPLEVLSNATGDDLSISSSAIEIQAQSEMPDPDTLRTSGELLEEIGSEETVLEEITHFVQTSTLGQSAIIVMPVCIVVILVITLISAIAKAIGKRRRQVTTAQQVTQS